MQGSALRKGIAKTAARPLADRKWFPTWCVVGLKLPDRSWTNEYIPEDFVSVEPSHTYTTIHQKINLINLVLRVSIEKPPWICLWTFEITATVTSSFSLRILVADNHLPFLKPLWNLEVVDAVNCSMTLQYVWIDWHIDFRCYGLWRYHMNGFCIYNYKYFLGMGFQTLVCDSV